MVGFQKFRCWLPKRGEDVLSGGTIVAVDVGEAAERYAEQFWNGYAESPQTWVVAVRGFGDIEVTIYEVEPEDNVTFYARRIA